MQQKKLRRISGFFVIFWADERSSGQKKGFGAAVKIRAAPGVRFPLAITGTSGERGKELGKEQVGRGTGAAGSWKTPPPTGDDICDLVQSRGRLCSHPKPPRGSSPQAERPKVVEHWHQPGATGPRGLIVTEHSPA